MIVVYSRYGGGGRIYAREFGPLASDFIAGLFSNEQFPKVAHADLETSMISKPAAALLVDLDVFQLRS
ncbi:hypothetical protein [Glutamicibacter creatinolyticus]|uniref:hypothetical protein n=1 Tax=Glutamicibacter creatinolyticus TaxID=162496 RepID=UPI00321712A2